MGSSGHGNSLATVDGGIGVVTLGGETLREASAPCCIEGHFSLSFDGMFALDVDLDDNQTSSAENLEEGLKGLIDEGEHYYIDIQRRV